MLLVRLETPLKILRVINIHAFRKGWDDRHWRMQQILEEDVLNVPEPVILGGDFNTTEQSETFQILRKILQNAHD